MDIADSRIDTVIKDTHISYYEKNKSNKRNTVVPVIEEPSFIKDVNFLEEFNTKRLLHNINFEVKGIPHIFITTPMLNLSQDNISKDSYLSWLADTYPKVLSMLSYGNSESGSYNTTSPFITLLSNTAMSFDAKDSVSKTKEIGETFYGYKLTIPAADVDSFVGDEIGIKYRDLPGLPVLNLHKAWFDYHNKVRRGILSPKREAILNHYIDYSSSIYYVLTEMDGETIQYWCKLTGLAPINVPYSAFSSDWSNHEIIEYSIQYVYSFKEEMNPEILLDLNKLSTGKSLDFSYNYNSDSGTGSLMSSIVQPAQHNKIYSPYEDNGGKKPLIVKGTRQMTNGLQGNSKYKIIYV